MLNEELAKKIRAEFARQGGLARAKSMTAKERRESSRKASKASVEARKKAMAKKKRSKQKS